MDNNQMPVVQPSMPSVVQQVNTPSAAQQVNTAEIKKDNSGLIKTIVIVVLSLMSVAFIGLFIWMNSRYNDVSSDVDNQIKTAVAEAKAEQAKKDEEDFAEREKSPYRTFAGPADYGQLTFKYPKTWSVYIASDASKGGDFEAYLNPIEVDAISSDAVYALRVSILNKDFESVTQWYQGAVENSESGFSMEPINLAGIVANRYTGTIPGTELNGYVVIFKIRDKTVVLQTDSVLFKNDFDSLLETITFNS